MGCGVGLTAKDSDDAPLGHENLRKLDRATIQHQLKSTGSCEPFVVDTHDEVAMATEAKHPMEGLCERLASVMRGSFAPWDRRTYSEAREVVARVAKDYVRSVDYIEGSFVQDILTCQVAEPLVRKFESMFSPSLSDVFAYDGKDLSIIRSVAQRRLAHLGRAQWADAVILSHTLHHNGMCTERALLAARGLPPDASGLSAFDWHQSTPSTPGECPKANARTEFLSCALAWKPPSPELVAKNMSKDPAHTHPRLAATRHLTMASLRNKFGAKGFVVRDTTISSATRDAGSYGERSIHTLKDLGHTAMPPPPGVTTKTKVVHTLIDCLNYKDTLAEFSGDDMAIWCSHYPDLGGSTDECVYWATSDRGYTEVIGRDDATALYREQVAWDFTSNDIVYIENLARSAFTVYKVVRYPQPDCLKMMVFLCALQTVNLPYAVVNELTVLSKGHSLEATGIGTPGPMRNVRLVPADPGRPGTQDILIKAGGTPAAPTIAVKYRSSCEHNAHVTMPPRVFEFIRGLNAQGGRKLTVHEVTKRLEVFHAQGLIDNIPAAGPMCELLRTLAYGGELPNAVYYHTSVHTAPAPPEEADNPTSAKAMAAAPNINTGGDKPCVPVKGGNAANAYVDNKMRGSRNDVEPPDHHKKVVKCVLHQFLQCIAKETTVKPGSVRLIDEQIIAANRRKPAQLARAETYGLESGMPLQPGRAEHKNEVLHKTPVCARFVNSPPHEVSILSGVLGKTLECILCESDISRGCGWYDPGSSPETIAERLRELYTRSAHVEENLKGGKVRLVDYTSADDTHSKFSNGILRALIEYFIHDDDREEALAIYDSCFNIELWVGDEKMSSLWKNVSGTGITTVLNTVVFAFREMLTTMYSLVFSEMERTGQLQSEKYVYYPGSKDTWRALPFDMSFDCFLKTMRNIQNYEKSDRKYASLFEGASAKRRGLVAVAYEWIGNKFGDDGVAPPTPFVNDGVWERAMLYVDKMEGFIRKLETSSAAQGEELEYLSRVFPDLLASLCSYCKVPKALAKLSVAINGEAERYIMKLCGYHTTDRNAPIVGAFLQACSNLYKVQLRDTWTDEQLAKLEEYDRQAYHKIAYGPLPWDEGSYQLCLENEAKKFGMTSAELGDFCDSLSKCQTWDEIQSHQLPVLVANETVSDPLHLTSVYIDSMTPTPEGVECILAYRVAIGELPERLCDLVSGDDKVAEPTEHDAHVRRIIDDLVSPPEGEGIDPLAAEIAKGMLSL